MKRIFLFSLILLLLGCKQNQATGTPGIVSPAMAEPAVTNPVPSVIPAPIGTPSMTPDPTPSPSPTPVESPVTLFSGGSGTEADPYLVRTVADFLAVSGYLDSHFVQMEDLDLTGVAMLPIGNLSTPFKGTYDGNGKTISHLSMTSTDPNSRIALFGAVAASGIVEHITLTGVDIHGAGSAAGIVGTLAGVVSLCSVYGTITYQMGFGPGINPNPIYSFKTGNFAVSSQNVYAVFFNGVAVNGNL